jgi:hypothetical protein
MIAPETLEEICQSRRHKRLWLYDTDMYTKIFYACMYGLDPFIENYVTSPLHLNYALQCACTHNNILLIKWITSRGVKHLNIAYALEVAHWWCNRGVILQLISCAKPEEQLKEYHSLIGTVPVLNQHLDDISTCHKYMHNACIYGYTNIVSLLLEKTMVTREYLMTACKHGQLDIVKLLLSNQEYNKYSSRGFQCACYVGKLHIVQYLLDKGVDHVKGLALAYMNKQNHIVSYLQSQVFGTTTSVEDIIIAKYWENEHTLKDLLDHLYLITFTLFKYVISHLAKHAKHLMSIQPLVLLHALRSGKRETLACIIKTSIPYNEWFLFLTEYPIFAVSDCWEVILDGIINHFDSQQCRILLAQYAQTSRYHYCQHIVDRLKNRVVLDVALVTELFGVACSCGNIDMVKHLITAYDLVPVSYGFHLACIRGHLNMATFLYNKLEKTYKVSNLVKDAIENLDLQKDECNGIVEFLSEKHPEHVDLLITKSKGNALLHDYLCTRLVS